MSKKPKKLELSSSDDESPEPVSRKINKREPAKKKEIAKKKEPAKKKQESSSEEEEDEEEETEELHANQKMTKIVHKWLDCDDQIRAYNKEIKELKSGKKISEKVILDLMTQYDAADIDISDGKLIKNVSKNKAALKQDMIEKTLTEIMRDPNKAKEVTQIILNRRPVVERSYLKRTFKRK